MTHTLHHVARGTGFMRLIGTPVPGDPPSG